MQSQKVNYPSKKIRIGQENWTVQVVPYSHPKLRKNWGICHWDNQTIYISNRLGQKNFEKTFTHELLHAIFDHIGFHDKLVAQFKTRMNEKLVDSLAQQLYPMLRPKVFKIPNHVIQKKLKTRD